jgi:hypothetical protein
MKQFILLGCLAMFAVSATGGHEPPNEVKKEISIDQSSLPVHEFVIEPIGYDFVFEPGLESDMYQPATTELCNCQDYILTVTSLGVEYPPGVLDPFKSLYLGDPSAAINNTNKWFVTSNYYSC